MYRRTLIAGVTAAAIVGAGGTALALSGSDTPSAAPTASGAAAATFRHAGLLGHGRLLRRLAHGTVVVRGKDGFVTHDLIAGTVTAVSSSSISVHATDGVSETFTVTKDTKVRVRTNGSGTRGTIGQVATGDTALVAGTGTSALTAKHVIDVKK